MTTTYEFPILLEGVQQVVPAAGGMNADSIGEVFSESSLKNIKTKLADGGRLSDAEGFHVEGNKPHAQVVERFLLFYWLLQEPQFGVMAALDLVKNLYNLLKLLLIMDVVMIHEREVIELFCRIDDFAEEFAALERKDLLPSSAEKKSGPPCCLAYSEIMAIMILFQMIGYRNFKYFYTGFLKTYWGHYFPNLPSYSRFIELMPGALMPLTIFITLNGGRRSGIYYIDSSCLPNCHIKRTKRHRTFKAVAKLGKTSVGWFFGLKLHLVINDIGELIAFKVTPGNHHDLAAGVSLFEGLEGLAFGDKGYIGKAVFEKLLDSGLKLITRKRKNMKNAQPLSDHEQQLLNQRGIIETVFGCLKHKFHIWHTRHRSVANAITHLVAGLAAYIIEPLTITAVKRLPSN